MPTLNETDNVPKDTRPSPTSTPGRAYTNSLCSYPLAERDSLLRQRRRHPARLFSSRRAVESADRGRVYTISPRNLGLRLAVAKPLDGFTALMRIELRGPTKLNPAGLCTLTPLAGNSLSDTRPSPTSTRGLA
jgi:hypothetical protein